MDFEPPTQFKKRGARQDLNFWRGVAEKEGVTFFQWVGVQLSHNILKSEMFNDKKSLEAKIFYFVITKNSNWEILPKNLVTFKR